MLAGPQNLNCAATGQMTLYHIVAPKYSSCEWAHMVPSSLSMAWQVSFFPKRPRSSKYVRSCGTSPLRGWIIPVQFLCTPASNTRQQLKEQHKWREFWRLGFYIGPQMERKVCRGRLSKWLVWHRDAANAHVPMLAPTDQYTNSHIPMHICMYVPFISLCKM